MDVDKASLAQEEEEERLISNMVRSVPVWLRSVGSHTGKLTWISGFDSIFSDTDARR